MNTTISNPVYQDLTNLTHSILNLFPLDRPGADGLSPTLRLVLVNREQLCLPNKAVRRLFVLMGTAWVSFDGQDFYLTKDDVLDIPVTKNGAIISAIGKDSLFFELT